MADILLAPRLGMAPETDWESLEWRGVETAAMVAQQLKGIMERLYCGLAKRCFNLFRIHEGRVTHNLYA